MQDYISISSDNEEDSLTHHGVKGMKWGRRKQRTSSSRSSKKSASKKVSNVKAKIKKTLDKVDKEKVKKIAKTSAVIAGGVALTATLGHVGFVAAQYLYAEGAKVGAGYQNYMDRNYSNYNGPVKDYLGMWNRTNKSYSPYRR